MPYLVDGHNLIPKLPGMHLSDLDDENQLIELLGEFCRIHRKQVEVYFDNSPPGGIRARSYGAVLARFIRQGTPADVAIKSKLIKLGRVARNWTVVSSDQAVSNAARAAHARSLSSEAFALTLLQLSESDKQRDIGENEDAQVNSTDIDSWLELFGENKSQV